MTDQAPVAQRNRASVFGFAGTCANRSSRICVVLLHLVQLYVWCRLVLPRALANVAKMLPRLPYLLQS